MNNCPNCNKRPATLHPQFGALPCSVCQDAQEKLLKPGALPEFTTEEIKLQRSEFMDDIEQTHYKGKLNKRWVETYGEKAARDRGFSQEEINKADYVMDSVPGIRYYNDRT